MNFVDSSQLAICITIDYVVTMASSDEKKERVIHTRISESLDEEIRRKATRLGVSVSNLVRNVLRNTFGLVEDIVADGANIAQSARGPSAGDESGRRSQATNEKHRDDRGRVVGWQEVILNLNAVCDSCNAILTKGAQAGIAVTERPGDKLIVCKRCLDKCLAQEEGHDRH